MKFSYKILLCTIIIMAAAFGINGYVFVNYVFETSMEREISQAMNDTSILQFAFETAALNIPSKYEILQDKAIEQIGANLDVRNIGVARLIRISDENKIPLYASEGFVEETDFLEKVSEQSRIYRVILQDERYYVQTGAVINVLDRIVYFETMKEVTAVYEERSQGFEMYRRVALAVLVFSSVIMFFISHWLTQPIRILSKAAKKMADGDYGYRAKQVSRDEMGDLTENFNQMANALEDNIRKLEEEVLAREEFIGAFSHELKTPLTAIIGYADLLRSHKLEEEKALLSANYIYTEGKRLETMSFRLLELMVTKRGEVAFGWVDVEQLFVHLKNRYALPAENSMKFEFIMEKGKIWAEQNLILTVLSNLIDNACKASEPGSLIEIVGQRKNSGYWFGVRDYGVGIPEEECRRITEAFYMVDKSRSRSCNGAGLGLALCEQILKLHCSELVIESKPGEGSYIGFMLPDGEEAIHDER